MPMPNEQDTDNTIAYFVITIHRRDDGSILTDHRPNTDKDLSVLMGWPTNGQVHVAQSLLTEAIRREARVIILTNLSRGQRSDQLDPEAIDGAIRSHFLNFLERFSLRLAKSVLEEMKAEGI